MIGTPAEAAPVALYVHFPFCVSICPYCDFVVVAGRQARGPASMVERLVDALVVEIGLRAAGWRLGRASLQSVYLGGGTPSLMSAAQAGRLLESADRSFGMASDAEVTIEANPGPAERGDLAGFRAAGVNRLSVGAQSMDAAELRRIGRRHSPADVRDTVDEARRAGFDNVSIDLLYDVPRQSMDAWRRTLDSALALSPDHVSAYALSLDDPDAEGLTGIAGDHLPLRSGARRWRERARREQDDDRAADMYLLADELLSSAGLGWYELSNWARAGRESRHNLAYWLGVPWAAVGPGAHAFDGAHSRRWNAAHLGRYLAALEAGRLPPGGSETSDCPTADAEAAMLRLRTRAGLARADVPVGLRQTLAWAAGEGLVELAGSGSWRLAARGRLLADELFSALVPDRKM